METEIILDELSDMHRGVPVPPYQHIQDMRVNLKTREIFVTNEIDESFGGWFNCAVRFLEEESKDPIVVWLNTPGGDVQSMFTFHDLVRSSQCEFTIVGTGQVCSAGVLMLACGNKRLVTESCILMSHRSETEYAGNMERMESYLKVVKWQEEHWAELMSRYTPSEVDGRPRDTKYWFSLGKKTAEWWITGGEAIVREGLADAMYSYDLLPNTSKIDPKKA